MSKRKGSKKLSDVLLILTCIISLIAICLVNIYHLGFILLLAYLICNYHYISGVSNEEFLEKKYYKKWWLILLPLVILFKLPFVLADKYWSDE